MKFASVLAFAASASAAALKTRQSTAIPVTGFTAICVPHSIYCNYAFAAKSDLTTLPSGCSAKESSTNGDLPAVVNGTCSDSPVYAWDITPEADKGLFFKFTYPLLGELREYCKKIPASDIETVDGGSVQDQKYIGPADFEATIEACL